MFVFYSKALSCTSACIMYVSIEKSKYIYIYIYIYIYDIILDRLKMENDIELPIMKFPLEVTNVNT